MREIALHVLDLMENSIAAGAQRVVVRVVQNRTLDSLEVTVEDDGIGLAKDPETILDPFFTTKPGKHTGLGLSLFREAAEQADGELKLSRSSLGGVAVHVSMRLGHIDRMPLGDLAATLGAVACTSPHVDIAWEAEVDGKRDEVTTHDMKAAVPTGSGTSLILMRQFSRRIRQGLEGLGAVQ